MTQEIQLLDHGFVALDETMGDDRTPARCARTSFKQRLRPRTAEEDARLIDYLIRHRHTTPLEFCQARFYIKCPLAVGEQILRHRTASINKISYRYVKAEREYYQPAPDRCQKAATDKKQGSSQELVADPAFIQALFIDSCETAFNNYEQAIAHGLAPEIARFMLPNGTYCEFYWQNDLHNILHFLGLRTDSHAQYETRVYADAMQTLLTPIFPTIIASWEKHRPRAD